MPFKPGQSVIRERKTAKLSEEFGQKLLADKFTADGAAMILAMFGAVSRGPRKGQPRGFISWTKVTRGGWDYSNQRVVRPGSSGYAVSLTFEGQASAPARCGFAESATHAEYMEHLCRALNAIRNNWNGEKGEPVQPCEFWNQWHAAAATDRQAATDKYRAQLRAEAERQIAEEAELDAEIARRLAAKAKAASDHC